MSVSAHVTRRSRSQRGFTLVEVTIILLVLVILSMIMLPQIGNFNRLARKVKVMEDLGAICASLKKFFDEVLVGAVWENPGGGEAPASGERIGLLHGPGTVAADPNGAPFHNVLSPADPWSQTAQGSPGFLPITVNTDAPGMASTSVDFGVDRFENHLIVNDPFADGSTAFFTRYANTSELAVGHSAFYLSWKGPYFDTFTSDPWGGRYLSNVFSLHVVDPGTGVEYFTSAVVCYSAGPDHAVSTPFNQPMDEPPYGWLTGGDDFAVVLSAGGPF